MSPSRVLSRSRLLLLAGAVLLAAGALAAAGGFVAWRARAEQREACRRMRTLVLQEDFEGAVAEGAGSCPASPRPGS